MNEVQEPEDPVITQARRRMNQLRQRLMQNEDFQELERLSAFLKTYEDLAAAKANGATRGRKPSDPELLPFLERVLREAGRPMSTRELLAKATEQGMQVGGNNPARNLSARLSSSASFKTSEDGTGWVLDEAAGMV